MSPDRADGRPVWTRGPVSVHFGAKSGKYPDGNQVVVRGSDTMVVFDTPQVANQLAPVLADADFAILGHVHEDHMAGLHLMRGKPLQVHEADLDAARSFEGLSRHYGYPPPVLAALRAQIEARFHYAPRPDAMALKSFTSLSRARSPATPSGARPTLVKAPVSFSARTSMVRSISGALSPHWASGRYWT